MESSVLMAVVLLLGILCRNQLLTAAAAGLLCLSAARLGRQAQGLQPLFLEMGVLCLIFALLLPLIAGQIGFRTIGRAMFSLNGLTALVIGIWATVLGRLGVGLLKLQPEVMLGITFGSVIGTAFFAGIPVGPLVAAGLVATIINLAK